jgi:hypothetical protein
MSICRRPNNKSFLPIDDEKAEKKAMVGRVEVPPTGVVGRSGAYGRVEAVSIRKKRTPKEARLVKAPGTRPATKGMGE